MKQNINAILVIAYRDVMKFFRDRTRIIATFIFPFVFMGILGGSLQANLGQEAGYNFLAFVFTGTLAQTLFQSSASGLISLIEDRENDFSQEIFVSPISRYIIIIGKIVGEGLVAMIQGIGVVLFSVIIGVHSSPMQLLSLIPIAFLICLFGGAFGVLVMSQLNNQRAANQIFPFLIFPQFFLAGVFNPIKNLPFPLLVLSRISPMTYAVDLIRNVYYLGRTEVSKVTLFPVITDITIIAVLFILFIILGTFFFVRNERNR